MSAGPRPKIELSLAEARRVALAAQGFGLRRTRSRSSLPRVLTAIDAMGLLQLDSVNVLVRSHYLPVFSRIGDYDRGALDRAAFAPDRRRFFEYWAHEASLLPLGLHPLMRWRMARAERLIGFPERHAASVRKLSDYIGVVRKEVEERGPIAASELDDPGKRSGPWWGWHRGKAALEHLFRAGIVTAASRRGFERVYDLTERVLPAEILALPTPSEADAIRALVAMSAHMLGIATDTDLRDYFRLPVAEARRAIAELVEEGVLEPAEVATWPERAYLARGAELPARIAAEALVSPFDPIVWYRPRTERLFGFHYRIELYTPRPKRRFGYYVLPFLEGTRLTARLDLKSDRAAGALDVLAAHSEPGAVRDRTPGAVAAEVRHLADWLGLGAIRVGRRGDLSADLARLI